MTNIHKIPTAVPLIDSSLSGKPPLSGLIAQGISVQSNPTETLISNSLDRLVTRLEGYGNKISRKHRQALKEVLTAYAMIARGEESGRWAFPLAPGVGKTQSIVALIAEAWAQGYFSIYSNPNAMDIDAAFSIAVSANKIEALCELKRDLVEAGVPGELIGLRHSYQYHKRSAEEYVKGWRVELKEGYASEPCTEDAFSKPILLCSHNLIRNRAGSLESFYSFKNRPRSLLIWDESLLKSQATGVSKLELEGDIAAMEVQHRNQLGDYGIVIRALKMAVDQLKGRLKNQEPGSPMWDIAMQDYLGPALELYQDIPEAYRYEAAKALFDLSEESLKVAEVYGKAKGAFIHSELVIPKELKNIVVLDASATIRKLMAADKSIRTVGSGGKNLVSYENVTVRQLQWNSGRTAMDRVVLGVDAQGRAMFRDIVEVVKNIPEDEAILFFVFKPKYSIHHKRRLDMAKKLVDKFYKLGMPDTVKVRDTKTGKMVEKNRFNFLTHGNETSTSKYAYCKHVVFCGVLWRDPLDITASTYGQTESATVLGKDLLKRVSLGEKAYAFHQGLCRSQCRYIEKVNSDESSPTFGKPLAKEANIWIIYKDESVAEPMQKILRKVMPHVRWEAWEPEHLELVSKIGGLGKKIVDWLGGQDGLDKISTKKLKQEMKLEHTAKQTFTHAVHKINADPNSGWLLRGRSLVLDNHGFTPK